MLTNVCGDSNLTIFSLHFSLLHSFPEPTISCFIFYCLTPSSLNSCIFALKPSFIKTMISLIFLIHWGIFIKIFLWLVVSFFWWRVLHLLLDFLVIFFLFYSNDNILILVPLEWITFWMMWGFPWSSILQEAHVEGWQGPVPIRTPHPHYSRPFREGHLLWRTVLCQLGLRSVVTICPLSIVMEHSWQSLHLASLHHRSCFWFRDVI